MRKCLLVACVVGFSSVFVAPIAAQSKFPDGKTVRIIVPYSAGGTADLTARMVSDRMSASLNAPVILDFRPGANLIIGATAGATAPPDGCTLFLGTGTSHTINPVLRSNLSYDPEKDFVPVSNINTSSYLVAVPADSPAKTLQEFVALAKSKPGKLTFGSFGAGNITHLAVEMFARDAGISLTHVPYKGSSQAEIDLITGRIDLLVTTFTLMPHVTDGKARILAVTTSERSPLLPDVPTVAESGYPNYEVNGWFALFVPAKTPADIVAVLNESVTRAVADPEVISRYAALGMVAKATKPEAMSEQMKLEKSKWESVVTALGLKDKI